MKKYYIIILFFIVLSGCISASDASKKCYNDQIGTYQFDTKNTVMGIEYSSDSIKLSNLQITFLSDSSFYTNFKAPFLEDTVGWWTSGTCGFESWGVIGFFNVPVQHQFSPNHGDGVITLTGKTRREGPSSQYLKFKKNK